MTSLIETKSNQQNIKKLRVPFGLKGGRLYLPSEVDKGKSCHCICPGCERKLVANQGEIKQPYFSHARGSECATGYESAIHLMAKQVISDALRVQLPDFYKSISKKIPGTEEKHSKEVVVKGETVQLSAVALEKTVEGLRPDILAITNAGEKLLIEIYVTHAVDEGKSQRLSHQNLMEIDLSRVTPDELADSDSFRNKVLFELQRHWLQCNLFNSLVDQARAELEIEVDALAKQHEIEKQAEIMRINERVALLKADEEKKKRIQERRDQLRHSIQNELKLLQDMAWPSEQEKRMYDLLHQAQPTLREMQARLSLGSNWPDELNRSYESNWIFNIHQSVWQAYIYERFIHGRVGTEFATNAVKQEVVSKFGMLDWVKTLIHLKYQQKQQGRSRKQWYGNSGMWFLDHRENSMIPSPYTPVKKYLSYLQDLGLLSCSDLDGRAVFKVAYNSFEELNTAKLKIEKQMRQAEVERANKEQAELEQEQRQRDKLREDRLQKRADRITELCHQATRLFDQGCTETLRCSRCYNIQSVSSNSICESCHSDLLHPLVLDRRYLEELPHRLKCLPIT